MAGTGLESSALDRVTPNLNTESVSFAPISAAHQANTFGAGRTGGAEAVSARENTMFTSGAVNLGSGADIYAGAGQAGGGGGHTAGAEVAMPPPPDSRGEQNVSYIDSMSSAALHPTDTNTATPPGTDYSAGVTAAPPSAEGYALAGGHEVPQSAYDSSRISGDDTNTATPPGTDYSAGVSAAPPSAEGYALAGAGAEPGAGAGSGAGAAEQLSEGSALAGGHEVPQSAYDSSRISSDSTLPAGDRGGTASPEYGSTGADKAGSGGASGGAEIAIDFSQHGDIYAGSGGAGGGGAGAGVRAGDAANAAPYVADDNARTQQRFEAGLGKSPFVANRYDAANTFNNLMKGPEWNQAEIARAEADRLYEHVTLLPESDASDPKNAGRSLEEVYRDRYGADPEKMASFNAWQDAQGKADYFTNNETALRTSMLEETTNKVLQQNGLPQIGLSTFPADGKHKGGYGCGQGEVILSDDLVNAGGPELTRTLIHELTHLDQDTIAYRRTADKMGIGAVATAEQQKELSQKVNHGGGKAAFIEQILQERNGEALSPQQAKRADAELAARAAYDPEFRAAPRKEAELQKNVAPIAGAIERLDASNGSSGAAFLNDLIKAPDAGDNRKLLQQPEITNLINRQQSGGGDLIAPLSDTAGSSLIKDVETALNQALARLDKAAQELHEIYRNWPWEKEARSAARSVDAVRQLDDKRAQKTQGQGVQKAVKDDS